jgi:hypothetical protein
LQHHTYSIDNTYSFSSRWERERGSNIKTENRGGRRKEGQGRKGESRHGRKTEEEKRKRRRRKKESD